MRTILIMIGIQYAPCYCDFFGVNVSFTRVPPFRLGEMSIVPPRLKARSFMMVWPWCEDCLISGGR